MPTSAPTSNPTPSPTATPVASIKIYAPELLEVSEDSTQTASFAVSLGTEPLSSVTVAFRSAFGGVVLFPSSVKFTYQDFKENVTIVATGVDDNIDQGNNHGDRIIISVFTEDLLFECLEADRPACGQGALYSNLTVPPLNITVLDNDEAGLVVSSTAVSATYNNFGDALLPGVYGVSLATQPRSEVVVAMSGLGLYSTVSPSSITFTPSSWNTSTLVELLASAPTTTRPVCSVSNRFCAALASRDETVTHSLSSSDKEYDGIAAASVALGVSVTYDVRDPPVVSEAAFGDLLNSITVTFDTSTDRAGQVGTFDCASVILDLTAVEVSTLLGTDNYCSFTDDDTLKITFGSDPEVLPGDVIKIRDLALKSSLSSASLFTMEESFVVGQPVVLTVPGVILSASSRFIGRCNDLILDGSATTGTGGRDLKYHFSVVSSTSSASVENVTKALEVANAANGGEGTYSLVIDAADMVPGSNFVVQLNVSNFLGQFAVSSVPIRVLNVPAPIIKIQGDSSVIVTRSDRLSLKAFARLPSTSCVGQSLSNSKMDFIWFEDSGLFSGALSGTSKSPRLLTIPADSLEVLNTYSFRVIGFMTDSPHINNTATVEVTVEKQALVAIISGGAYRQIGRSTAFTLDASESYNPDDPTSYLSYTWSSDSSEASSVLTSSSSITVPANTLSVGTHTFSLTVLRDTRSATTTVTVEVQAGTSAVISIASLVSNKVNNDGGFILVRASVASALSSSTTWSMEDSDVEEPFVSKGAAVATIANELSAVVSLSTLTVGNTYTLVFLAEGSDGSSSYSSLSFDVNEAPSSGRLEVSPSSGYALTTDFSFSALNWVDEDLPLTYLFGTVRVLPTTTGVSSSRNSPFGGKQSDASLNGVVLPPGDEETGFGFSCFVEVFDSYGASGSSTDGVQVTNNVELLTIAQLFNISGALTTAAIESADADGAKRLLLATLSVSSSIVDESTSRRRALLGTGTDASVLLAAALEDLWLTYAITPVTSEDIGSLLSVLDGILSTPSDVTTAVGKSAFQFLSTVFQDSFDAEIGISDESLSYSGTALTLLTETSLFNASDVSSLTRIVNITSVLDLVSALQLFGAESEVGYTFESDNTFLFSYRNSLESLENLGALHLSLGGSTDLVTAVSFSGPTFEEVSSYDVRLMTLASDPYASWLKGTLGSAAARDSRTDQGELEGTTLLRSKVTVVRLAPEDKVDAVDMHNLEDTVAVTLAATAPFDTNHSDYIVVGSCAVDGAQVTLDCPLADVPYTCDFDAGGQGGKYLYVYVCPKVVPTCLSWDYTADTFTTEGCAVVPGYTSDAVTCACDHLGTFVLSANTTAPSFSFETTDRPTPEPSALPTPQPSHIPTARPTALPTNQPTPDPTHNPTALPTTSPPTLIPTTADTVTAAVSFEVVATAAPTDADVALLRTTVADTLSVNEGAVRHLAVVSAQRRRVLLADSYTWSISFDVSVSLSLTSAVDVFDFVADVSTKLNKVSFVIALASALTSITSVGQVTANAYERAPSKAPAVAPLRGPSPQPSSAPSTDAKSVPTGASLPPTMIALIVGAGLVLVLTGVAVQVRRTARAKGKVAPASPYDLPPGARFDGRPRLDPLSDGGGSLMEFLEVTTSRLRPWGYSVTTTTTTTTPTPGGPAGPGGAVSPPRSPLSMPPSPLFGRNAQVAPMSSYEYDHNGMPLGNTAQYPSSPASSTSSMPAPMLLMQQQAQEGGDAAPANRRVVRLRPLTRPPPEAMGPSLYPESLLPRFGDGRRRVAPLPSDLPDHNYNDRNSNFNQNSPGWPQGPPIVVQRRPPLSADGLPGSPRFNFDPLGGGDYQESTFRSAESSAYSFTPMGEHPYAVEDDVVMADGDIEELTDQQASLEADTWGYKADLRRADLAQVQSSRGRSSSKHRGESRDHGSGGRSKDRSGSKRSKDRGGSGRSKERAGNDFSVGGGGSRRSSNNDDYSRSEAARKVHEIKQLQELDKRSQTLNVRRAEAEQRRARAAEDLARSLEQTAPAAARGGPTINERFSATDVPRRYDPPSDGRHGGGFSAHPPLVPDRRPGQRAAERHEAYELPRRLEPLNDPRAAGGGGGGYNSRTLRNETLPRRGTERGSPTGPSASRLAQRRQHQMEEQKKRTRHWKENGPKGL